MSRSILLSASFLLLSSLASAQTTGGARVLPVTAQVKHGGTYHVATKTWSRSPGPIAALGPDVLYNNNCIPSFFLDLGPGQTVVDSGLLPDPSATPPGTLNAYGIDGLQLAYCTSEAPTVDLFVGHFDAYQAGQDATQHTHVSSVMLANAPGSSVAGSLSCWIINVDLSGSSFTLSAGSSTADTFGWEFMQLTPPASGPAGPFLSGDPQGVSGNPCPYGGGTVFGAPGPGTGLGSVDLATLYQNGPTSAPAASLVGPLSGGYPAGPYVSFWHQLFGDATLPAEPGVAYCDGGAAAPVPCPCGNANDGSAGGPAGCANTNNATGGILRASGDPFAPPPGQLVLSASNVEPGAVGLFFQGDSAIGGGNGAQFGDGLRCAGINVVRLEVRVADASGDASTTVDIAAVGQWSPGQTKFFQYWYRTPTLSSCGNSFNLTNGYRIP